MDQAIRNKLRNVITQCRKLLEDTTAQALQGRFGIYIANRKDEVHIEDESRMTHLTEEDRACRQDLLDHLEHIQAIGYKPQEALDQLIREISFTHLNRLCAYKMMEARGIIREAVSRGLKSQGFFFYLADHPDDEKLHNNGQQELAYRNYLDWLGGTLSEEIGVLFNPNDPANRIYPPQRVLDDVLALINDLELKDIWSQDETIGWIYQFFTPKELRDKARKESQAPRNSYELAFRNQFFTPRYVVEFLTDNTLGRIWQEMRKGKTSLRERCQYLVRRPKEVFLAEGDESPDNDKEARDDIAQEELLKHPVYILHRPKKDPRDIKILDPACGSGHFLLYCFDLLQIIYEEAYDDPDLAVALRKDYPALEDLRRDIPGLILKHNLHGIDIDLRATQIAALALWLRCQRFYQELDLKNSERPLITQANIVCAEPMPGQSMLLKEFTATLQPKVLGQLVEVIFQKMKLSGEAGSLLKIEEEIKDSIAEARKQWLEGPKMEQVVLFPEMVKPKPEQQKLRFDLSGVTDEQFWDQAEDRILDALKNYAERAENGRVIRRRLFAEDAVRGFSFIDLCRNRYDIVLMNPPFGVSSSKAHSYLSSEYKSTSNDLYAAFIERSLVLSRENGLNGSITSRTYLHLPSFYELRRNLLGVDGDVRLLILAEMGIGVLDGATVRAALNIIYKSFQQKLSTIAFGLRGSHDYEKELLTQLNEFGKSGSADKVWVRELEFFYKLPGLAMSYWVPEQIANLFLQWKCLGEESIGKQNPSIGNVRVGLTTGDDFRFVRLWHETSPNFVSDSFWKRFLKGGEFRPFENPSQMLVYWEQSGSVLKNFKGSYFRNEMAYDKKGIVCPYISDKGIGAQPCPSEHAFGHASRFIEIKNKSNDSLLKLMILLNTETYNCLLACLTADRKHESGILASLPVPSLSGATNQQLISLAKEITFLLQTLQQSDETSPIFFSLLIGIDNSLKNIAIQKTTKNENRRRKVYEILKAAENLLWMESGIDTREWENFILLAQNFRATETAKNHSYTNEREFSSDKPYDIITNGIYNNIVKDMISWFVGNLFGRWEIRFTTGESKPQKLPEPFDPLPICPPGILQGPNGLPANSEDVPSNYPIRIDWDGIIADDPEHEDDIVRRVREVLEVIWRDRAEAIEKEACEILEVKKLRDYFRKPGNGGFWMDHVKRYSKSRRKAPIYWYLRSAKGNYGLWLYYHRLDKDILFKALLNYVEPKIRLEEDRLNTMRIKKEATGSSGREVKQLEKDIDRLEQFASELHDFAQKLHRAADLRVDFDLNDGVILNMAPLWELIPWSEPKKYWEELQEGKYDWSHIAYQLWPERVKELCKKDRSIAIAHGREDLCEVEPTNTKRNKRVK
jgi:hypothetical protein